MDVVRCGWMFSYSNSWTRLTVGNDGHVTDVDALIHELTDLMNMLAMFVSNQRRPTYFFDGEVDHLDDFSLDVSRWGVVVMMFFEASVGLRLVNLLLYSSTQMEMPFGEGEV